MVYNTALGYVQNMEDAEEVMQDVFVEIHQSLKTFRGESALKTWIYRITINKSLDFLKYKKRKKRFSPFISILSSDSIEPGFDTPDFNHPGVLLENKERAAILFKAINTLPEMQRTVFLLAKLEDLGNMEIAEILNKKPGAIESLLSRAKENLKSVLREYYKS